MKPDNLDRALERLGKSSTEGMEAAHERVQQSLRANASVPVSDEALDVRPPNVWRLRQPYFVAAAALLLVMLGVFGLRPSPTAIQVVDGKVVVANDGSVRTEDGAVVALSDGSRVEMRAQAQFRIERADDGLRIHLFRGGVIVNAAKQRAGHLYVQTKEVTVSVIGTVFLVNAEEEGSRVAVIEGQVRVQQGSNTKDLLPGEQLTTNPKLERLSVKDELAWSIKAPEHVALLAQSAVAASAPKKLVFDAASIKLYEPKFFGPNEFYGFACHGTDGIRAAQFGNGADPAQHVPLGRCVGDSVGLRFLLFYAFDLPQWQLQFGPNAAALRNETYQIQASSGDPTNTTLSQLKQMLQTMITDRFNMKSHRDNQEFPGYAMVVAKGGPKLKESSGPEEGPTAYYRSRGEMAIKGKTTLDTLARWLAETTNGGIALAPVVNKTGLTAIYEYDFVKNGTASGGVRGNGGANPKNPPNTTGMGPEEYARYIVQVRGPNYQAEDRADQMSDAMEEHLGLKLQPEKIPVEFFIVDSIDKPTPN
jgi:uncharacterized protein (TIGR03435 family)